MSGTHTRYRDRPRNRDHAFFDGESVIKQQYLDSTIVHGSQHGRLLHILSGVSEGCYPIWLFKQYIQHIHHAAHPAYISTYCFLQFSLFSNPPSTSGLQQPHTFVTLAMRLTTCTQKCTTCATRTSHSGVSKTVSIAGSRCFLQRDLSDILTNGYATG